MTVERIIGIDLGTTTSCVAVWLPEWEQFSKSSSTVIEVLTNDQGKRITPSCVAFTSTQRIVGEPAIHQARRNVTNTVYQVKRLIGRSFDDEAVQDLVKYCPYKIKKGKGDIPKIVVQSKNEEKEFYPQEISGMVLQYMKRVAEMKLGEGKVNKAVITVPAHFNNSQRQATRDAGKLAGLQVVRIINEPTAAAFAYGLHESLKGQQNRTILVFDLGGGTFDVSILQVYGKQFVVKATGGDSELGGEDFNIRLLEYCANQFQKTHKVNIHDNANSLGKLRSHCEKAKCDLSFLLETTIDIDSLYNGIDFVMQITRARLEDLLDDYFTTCIDTVESVLNDAKMSKSQIDDIVMVGGSSRIPKLQRMVSDFFDGKQVCKSLNPDEAVAYGAAVQGALLAGSINRDIKDIVLKDVIPLPIGVHVRGDLFNLIVPKNTQIPCTKSEILRTIEDNQTSIWTKILQGGRPLAKDNQLLGEIKLYGLTPAPKYVTKIDNVFEIDEDGVLKVTLKEVGKDNSTKVTLTNEYLALSKDELARILKDAESYRKEDKKERDRIKSRLKLDDVFYKLQEKLKVSHDTQKEETLNQEREWFAINQNASQMEFESKIKIVEKLL
eukprot:TRINITY_DN55646_c0_g1_i3.p1 TRINITY_DN55646_c0_g1~~TRINITY_DN55646_c0_g1_i3.p1  ORF type:complete len:609 (+),score=65.48 TRINITY_DN55646_c0_g1_i3:434-2260(+)